VQAFAQAAGGEGLAGEPGGEDCETVGWEIGRGYIEDVALDQRGWGGGRVELAAVHAAGVLVAFGGHGAESVDGFDSDAEAADSGEEFGECESWGWGRGRGVGGWLGFGLVAPFAVVPVVFRPTYAWEKYSAVVLEEFG